MSTFSHPAMEQQADLPMVYTAYSKHLFWCRELISVFVLELGAVPLNPFMIFAYFLTDKVSRDDVRRGNNTVVRRSDELWVFGPISDGVLSEIILAQDLGKKIRYFAVKNSRTGTTFTEITVHYVVMEQEVEDQKHLLQVK